MVEHKEILFQLKDINHTLIDVNYAVEDIVFKSLLTSKDVLGVIKDNIDNQENEYGKKIFLDLLSEIIKPNITYDNQFTEKIIDTEINFP